jgi:hypothetical protein
MIRAFCIWPPDQQDIPNILSIALVKEKLLHFTKKTIHNTSFLALFFFNAIHAFKMVEITIGHTKMPLFELSM